MLHRLRSALRAAGTRPRLAGTVEVDETFIGGEEHGLRGRAAARQEGPDRHRGMIGEPKGIGRCRMAVLADASGASLGPFVAGSVEPGSRVITDGWVGYNGLAALGYAHERRNQKAAARRGQRPRRTAARRPPDLLAVQAVAAGHPPGQGRTGRTCRLT